MTLRQDMQPLQGENGKIEKSKHNDVNNETSDLPRIIRYNYMKKDIEEMRDLILKNGVKLVQKSKFQEEIQNQSVA